MIKTRTILLTLALSATSLSFSCVSYYAAGTFGKDAIPAPPPLPRDAETAESTETFLFGHANFENEPYADDSGNMKGQSVGFVQGGAMLVRRKALADYAKSEWSGAASAWYGKASIEYADAYTDTTGLIPGEYDFYGGTAQVSGVLRFGGRGGARIGFLSLLSYERGPYADFREAVSTLLDSYGYHPYSDLSPSEWTQAHRLEASMDLPLNDEAAIRLSADCGVSYDGLNPFNAAGYPIYGLTAVMRTKAYALFASYRMTLPLGDSLGAGLLLRL